MQKSNFDFNNFRKAFESKNAADWSSYYSDDAEWYEYRQWSPPANPNVMKGKVEIGKFIERVCSNDRIELKISDEVISDSRIAFRLAVSFPDGRMIIENIIADILDGKIIRQVDVEAWDEGLH
jgi:hypothetical protein